MNKPPEATEPGPVPPGARLGMRRYPWRSPLPRGERVNLATIFDRHPDDAVAFISRGKNTTYGELRGHVAGYRAGLAEMGLEPGDRLAIICGNN